MKYSADTDSSCELVAEGPNGYVIYAWENGDIWDSEVPNLTLQIGRPREPKRKRKDDQCDEPDDMKPVVVCGPMTRKKRVIPNDDEQLKAFCAQADWKEKKYNQKS